MKRNSETTITLVTSVALSAPTAANANMIWPAIFVEARLLSVPVIIAGLAIEICVLALWFRLSWARAAVLATTVNVISACIGMLAIPLFGVLWEVFPGILLYSALDMGTFNPLTWSATFVIAVAVTSAIEIFALRRIFRFGWRRRRWAVWILANAASVTLAFLSLVVEPQNPMELYDPWIFTQVKSVGEY